MMSKRTKPPKCTKVLLEGGTSDTDHKFLDIAPTMQSITHDGRRYFRCPKSQGQDPTDGQWGMMYLWDGWGEWRMASGPPRREEPMTHAERLTAIKRLRKAAMAAMGKPETVQWGRLRLLTDEHNELDRAWRAFPECSRDEQVPPPAEVLLICDRMEREQAADDEFCAAMKGRG